jgi:hypothetical protein
MHPFIRHLSLALLTTAATGASSAADTPAGQRVEVTAPQDTLVAAATVLPRRNLDATDDMSTGRSMTVLLVGDAVRMRYGRQRQAVLRHDGQGRFVSSDGLLSLEFALDRAGDPHAVRLSMPGSWL